MPENDSWALPPIEKIYEAFSAIADNKVKMSQGSALVSSSDFKKEYTVVWNEGYYSSNDNASYWRGFMGYPVIAVLLLQGRLNYNKAVPEYFKDINWKKLNTEYKNQYDKAVSSVLDRLASEGTDIAVIKDEVQRIYDQIKQLDIKRRRSQSPKK